MAADTPWTVDQLYRQTTTGDQYRYMGRWGSNRVFETVGGWLPHGTRILVPVEDGEYLNLLEEVDERE